MGLCRLYDNLILFSLSDFLVMHLQELVRMVFIAATAICDQLKLAGLSTLQVYTRHCNAVERLLLEIELNLIPRHLLYWEDWRLCQIDRMSEKT